MKYVLYSTIGIVAIIINLIVNLSFFKNGKNDKSKTHKFYLIYLIFTFLFMFIDSVWAIFYLYKCRIPLYINTILYFLTTSISVLSWCNYCDHFLKMNKKVTTFIGIYGTLFFLSEIVCIFLNDFFPIFFSYNEDCEYSVYWFRYLTLFAQEVIFFILAVYALMLGTIKKEEPKKRYFAVFFYSISMFLNIICQSIFTLFPMYTIGLLIGSCFLHVFVEESEKENLLKKLRENENELKDNYEIFSNAGYGIWKIEICPAKKNKMIVNDTLAKIFGIEDMKLPPEELYVFYHSRLLENVNEIENDDYENMKTGAVRSRVLAWNHPTKGRIFINAGGTQHISDNGDCLISGYCADVTTSIEAREELTKNLELAKEQAETANKAKTKFLFNMSHDIRTPMNAIMGFTDLLEKNLDDKEKCENYISKIQGSSKFLLSLINNVLEMARIESGKSTLDEAPLNIDEFIQTIYSVFEEQMAQKNLDFDLYKEVPYTSIYGDSVKLKEIFLNIISNSYKYTLPGGKVFIAIRSIGVEDNIVTIETSFEDTGIGMSKEFLPKLFEEFSREKTYTDTKIEGTGLGMPIVKKYVELMNGFLAVESELGKGTKYKLVLKHRIVQEDTNTDQHVDSISIDKLQGLKILLAEDNDLNAEIAMELLKEFGFIIERVADGVECVDKIDKSEEGTFDLILMDVQMPNMDGYRATQTIRKFEDSKKANIPIVAMTANAFEEDRRKALEIGMNGHISKPIDINILLKTLADIFKR